MKKLLIIIAAMLVLFTGCIQNKDDTPAASVPTPAASVQATPSAANTQTPLPAVSTALTEKIPDTEEIPVPAVVSVRTESRRNERIIVDIHYPEISGMIDAEMQQEVNEIVYNRLIDKAAAIERDAAEAGSAVTYYINSTFMVRRNDGLFLSISEEIQFYNGGATIHTGLEFINLKNTSPGQQLALRDLFLPGVDHTAEINGRISGMIATDPEKADFDFRTIKEDQGFYITGSDLVIAFEVYDIAPGTSGAPEFLIPLADLSDILIPGLI